jgi:hypothetical protein
MLRPHQVKSFAWTYPLQEKLISVTACSNNGSSVLGPFNIDSIKQTERIYIQDKA